MRRTIRRGALALVGVAWLATGTAQAWTPTEFEGVCGHSFYHASTLKPSADAYAKYTGDPDRTAAATTCLDAQRVARVQNALSNALSHFSKQGYDNPSPGRLGPVIPESWRPAQGSGEAVRFYLHTTKAPRDKEKQPPGEASPACHPDRSSSGPLAYMMFNPDDLRAVDMPSIDWMSAHELAHVVQMAQPLWTSPAGSCGELPGWVMESLADAMTGAFHRAEHPGFKPARSTDYGPHMLGLRPFSNRTLDSFIRGSRDENGRLPQGWSYAYKASAFWRWLSERYHGGKTDFYAKVMRSPLKDPAAPDWLTWLEDSLSAKENGWGIGQSLHLVFPMFLGAYADWGTSRWSHIGDEAWRKEVFWDDGNECPHKATLSPQSPMVTLQIQDLEGLTGRCIDVEVAQGGLGSGQKVWYGARILPSGISKDHADGLHLVSVEWGGRLQEKAVPSRCHEAEKKAIQAWNSGAGKRDIPACLIEPLTAEQRAATNLPEAAAMRVWASETRIGGGWTDRLILARTPAEISDAGQERAGKIDVLITFSLETTAMSIDGTPASSPEGGVNFRPPGMRRLALDATEDLADPQEADPSMMMFQQMAPGGLGAALPKRSGLHQVTVFESLDDDMDEVGLSFVFTPGGEPIPYGATGTFQGWRLQGVDPRGGMRLLGSPRPDAEVTVLAWDRDRLQLEVRGNWCYQEELERTQDGARCRVKHRVGAQLWVAFGDAYDADNPYVSIDTPVQALYREAFARAVGFGAWLSGESFPGGPGGPGGPSGPASPGNPEASVGGSAVGAQRAEADTQGCDCSCAGLARLERAIETMQDSGQADLSLAAPLLRCAQQCMGAYTKCEVE